MNTNSFQIGDIVPFTKICPILISMRFGNARVMYNYTGFPEQQFSLPRDKNKKSLSALKKNKKICMQQMKKIHQIEDRNMIHIHTYFAIWNKAKQI